VRWLHTQDIKKVRAEASALVKYMVSMKSTGEFNAAASRRLYDAIKAMVDFQKTVGEVRARLRICCPHGCAFLLRLWPI
jgi:predicted RNA-binding Zn ribbon-like protein